MFRGRAANPCSNKFLYAKQIEQRQKAHRERLKTMRPAIDNTPPKKPSHLTNNKKKEAQMEEHFLKIERENRLLLEKMSYIMSQKALDNKNEAAARQGTKSLNKSYRKKELQRITEENQKILRRIQERQPYYNHAQWEEERRLQERYVRNICEYPVNGDKKRRRRRRRGPGAGEPGASGKKGVSRSRSGLIPSLDSEYQRHSREKLDRSLHGESASTSHLNGSSSGYADFRALGAPPDAKETRVYGVCAHPLRTPPHHTLLPGLSEASALDQSSQSRIRLAWAKAAQRHGEARQGAVRRRGEAPHIVDQHPRATRPLELDSRRETAAPSLAVMEAAVEELSRGLSLASAREGASKDGGDASATGGNPGGMMKSAAAQRVEELERRKDAKKFDGMASSLFDALDAVPVRPKSLLEDSKDSTGATQRRDLWHPLLGTQALVLVLR
ncbi:Hypothetical Protein FCC1311_040982 [Hondaea fermentalgiana]|uniref:Cilia- and flagella-associated protein 97 n=1 Tax=Hondaea fermentalgiana TaxID=2315210 RepID=A0A2R5GBA3_9STRA|nr:Hypothetical Protein FCC1311_040982 [Hondaea fermentalgiana]|eukprot:GBG27875.1 Hypothetical Protein FCC1311_040982 [Hondaea fermentalgiana]